MKPHLWAAAGGDPGARQGPRIYLEDTASVASLTGVDQRRDNRALDSDLALRELSTGWVSWASHLSSSRFRTDTAARSRMGDRPRT
jgi:hypothetical protein